MDVNAEVVRNLFTYDPVEGVLRWRNNRFSARAGAPAGSMTNGARQVELGGRTYLAHRLVWLYVTGEWPKQIVEHKNGVRDDNRWDNLRDVSRTINGQNMRGATSNSTHGYMGVTKAGARWKAMIALYGVKYHIGYYKTPEEANAAYLDVKRLFHEGCTI